MIPGRIRILSAVKGAHASLELLLGAFRDAISRQFALPGAVELVHSAGGRPTRLLKHP